MPDRAKRKKKNLSHRFLIFPVCALLGIKANQYMNIMCAFFIFLLKLYMLFKPKILYSENTAVERIIDAHIENIHFHNKQYWWWYNDVHYVVYAGIWNISSKICLMHVGYTHIWEKTTSDRAQYLTQALNWTCRD